MPLSGIIKMIAAMDTYRGYHGLPGHVHPVPPA